ncbi:MAG: YihY/virulence factor BrkB family protein [Flavisolibacter sp.]|nr:YihY/virulence factor BrkB family protein [Flavisolibacter sp.]
MRKKITPKGVWNLLKQAFTGFSSDKVLKMSGSLAYSTVFSIAPVIIVVIFLADIFYGREAIEGTIYGQIKAFVGSEAALQIQNIIRNVSLSSTSKAAAAVGIVTLLLGATSVFAEIQDSINIIWGLKPKPRKGWAKMLLNRLLSFSVVVSLGFILLVSLVLNALIEALMGRLQRLFPDVTVVLVYVVNLLVTLGITTLLFGIIFKVLPDARIKWRDVLTGALTTAVLFMIGKFAITFYISHSNVSSAYGAAGSLVVILLWVYYSSVILYFGAEFTKVYAAAHGTRIMPNPYAVWVKLIEVEEEDTSLQQVEQQKEEENRNTGDHIKVK